MNISMTSELYKQSPFTNLKGGMSTVMQEPQNQMVKALNHFKMAQHQQIEIKARIIKLRKEEEKAAKRIKDANERADFVQKMHQLKSDKIDVKRQFYNQMKEEEDKNRDTFNHTRQAQKFVNQRNKSQCMSQNKAIRNEIKQEQAKIESLIQKSRQEAIVSKQRAYMEMKEIKQRSKALKEMQMQKDTMMTS
jgi:hypothetical protein